MFSLATKAKERLSRKEGAKKNWGENLEHEEKPGERANRGGTEEEKQRKFQETKRTWGDRGTKTYTERSDTETSISPTNRLRPFISEPEVTERKQEGDPKKQTREKPGKTKERLGESRQKRRKKTQTQEQR